VGSTRRTFLPPKWVQVRSLRGGKKSQKKKEKEEVELAYVRANRDVAIKLTFPKALEVGGHCLGLAQESGLIGLEQLAAIPFPAHRLMLSHLKASLDSLGLLESVTTKPSEAQIVEALASWLLGVTTISDA
ncbi:unnamed protein product, partial [Durusdinium trenchii]